MSLIRDLLNIATAQTRSPQWDVVLAHAEGRVLHFNGGQCYIIDRDGTLVVTDTSHHDATVQRHSPDDDFAKAYITQNPPRPASASAALSLAQVFGLF